MEPKQETIPISLKKEGKMPVEPSIINLKSVSLNSGEGVIYQKPEVEVTKAEEEKMINAFVQTCFSHLNYLNNFSLSSMRKEFEGYILKGVRKEDILLALEKRVMDFFPIPSWTIENKRDFLHELIDVIHFAEFLIELGVDEDKIIDAVEIPVLKAYSCFAQEQEKYAQNLEKDGDLVRAFKERNIVRQGIEFLPGLIPRDKFLDALKEVNFTFGTV